MKFVTSPHFFILSISLAFKILTMTLRLSLLVLCIMSLSSCDFSKYKLSTEFDFETRFENSNGTETATYEEVITYYQNLAESHQSIAIYEMDKTDSGEPLHIVTYNANRTFESEFNGGEEQNIILINNGIHPGESDGIDASMMLLRDFAENRIKVPENTIVAVIPIYNIGGALNRNSTTRTNQNGPKSYGFRGNARNYDLNRDFIKSDTKNAKAFAKLYHTLKPDVFIDNHVSNGADYQYTLTHLLTQHNKLGEGLGTYLHDSFMPKLEEQLESKDWPITPYVNVFNQVPETGFSQFMDHPRYSTGYTTLFNTLGMMVETHMLKPYKQRVEGTYEFMRTVINMLEEDGATIKKLRKENETYYRGLSEYPLEYKTDSTKTSTLNFKGYEADRTKSNVTGLQRLKYDRDKPFTKEVSYYNNIIPTRTISVPKSYVIPQGWQEVISLLRLNNIKLERFDKDTTLTVTAYRIVDYKTRNSAYEGHYLHSNTKVTGTEKQVTFREGDYKIDSDQPGIRYILETLEPSAIDSFFNWNFFDSILQQKEGFSPYVFEDVAEKLLQDNPKLNKEFEAKKASDKSYRSNWYMQLDWLHKQSPNYESAHLQYPVYRLE
jgi:hypothetical protein